MQAIFKKLQLTPVKFNKDGDLDKDEFATLTVDIPIVDSVQAEKVQELLGLLSKELIYIEVYGTQQEAE